MTRPFSSQESSDLAADYEQEALKGFKEHGDGNDSLDLQGTQQNHQIHALGRIVLP
jgi:hypothetical protein